MAIGHLIDKFAGLPVENWEEGAALADPQNTAYRIRVEYDAEQEWTEVFADFLADENSSQVVALIVGCPYTDAPEQENMELVIEALVAACDRLPNLKHLFLAEMTFEECEISWIVQTDLTPIFSAYPQLETLSIRGSNNLTLGSMSLPALKSLTIESGGLPAEIVHAVCVAQLPNLEHLELWLGVANYGGTVQVADIKPLLTNNPFAHLKYLGIRNSEIVDDIAKELKDAPVLSQIDVLDLSLGTLTDEGAEHLLNNDALKKLSLLDLHHHFCSNEMMAKLEASSIKVDISERLEAESYGDGEIYRYTSVSE